MCVEQTEPARVRKSLINKKWMCLLIPHFHKVLKVKTDLSDTGPLAPLRQRGPLLALCTASGYSYKITGRENIQGNLNTVSKWLKLQRGERSLLPLVLFLLGRFRELTLKNEPSLLIHVSFHSGKSVITHQSQVWIVRIILRAIWNKHVHIHALCACSAFVIHQSPWHTLRVHRFSTLFLL